MKPNPYNKLPSYADWINEDAPDLITDLYELKTRQVTLSRSEIRLRCYKQHIAIKELLCRDYGFMPGIEINEDHNYVKDIFTFTQQYKEPKSKTTTSDVEIARLKKELEELKKEYYDSNTDPYRADEIHKKGKELEKMLAYYGQPNIILGSEVDKFLKNMEEIMKYGDKYKSENEEKNKQAIKELLETKHPKVIPSTPLNIFSTKDLDDSN